MSDQVGYVLTILISIGVVAYALHRELNRRPPSRRYTPRQTPPAAKPQPAAPPPSPEEIAKNKADSPVSFSHPANAGILNYLMGQGFRVLPSLVPPDDYYRSIGGTHPDLIEILWVRMPKLLPENCAWIVYGRPALVNKSTGIVFGFAVGTSLIGLRLPDKERQLVMDTNPHSQKWRWSTGEEVFVRDLGEDWVFVNFSGQEQNCLRAYEYAGQFVKP